MLGLIHSNSCIADLLIRGDKDSSFKVDRRTDQTLGYVKIVKIMFARQVTLHSRIPVNTDGVGN